MLQVSLTSVLLASAFFELLSLVAGFQGIWGSDLLSSLSSSGSPGRPLLARLDEQFGYSALK